MLNTSNLGRNLRTSFGVYSVRLGVASVSAGLVEAFEPVSVGLVIGLASFWSYAFLLRVIERETYRMYEKVIESI